MGLISPVNVKQITKQSNYQYQPRLSTASPVKQTDILELDLQAHMDAINKKSYFPKYHVEEILLRQKQFELWRMKKDNRFAVPEGLVKFTPSSASKAKRDLFYKALRVKPDEGLQLPFNNRWTRNSTAVHEAVQRDLLYGQHLLKNPLFTVNMLETEEFGNLPAWEKVIENYKVITHKGTTFVVSGMMDGMLTHAPTGKAVGFEFKTKTNDATQVQYLNKPADSHIKQCVAYSLVFEDENGEPLLDYLITYEAVPKDKWLAGDFAVQDVKAFHIKVTERQRQNLLNRFAEVAECVATGELPPVEKSKLTFTDYRSKYEELGEL